VVTTLRYYVPASRLVFPEELEEATEILAERKEIKK
jgi:hypothetical protein